MAENRERLSELPAPSVATSYYSSGDLYLFDARPLRGASRAVVARERSSLESGRRREVGETAKPTTDTDRKPRPPPQDFQVSTPPESRRPVCETLLDVFTNIAIDEGEHARRGADAGRVEAVGRFGRRESRGRRGSAWTPRISLDTADQLGALDAADQLGRRGSSPHVALDAAVAGQDDARLPRLRVDGLASGIAAPP